MLTVQNIVNKVAIARCDCYYYHYLVIEYYYWHRNSIEELKQN